MATREEEIRGLRQLKEKQEQISVLEGKISTAKSQIDQLRQQRKSTASLTLLPTDTAEKMEAQLLEKVNYGMQRRRIYFKILLILLVVGLLVPISVLFYQNSELLCQSEPMLKEVVEKYRATDPDNLQASPLYNVLLLSGLFSLSMLIATFVPWEKVPAIMWIGVIIGLLGVVLGIICCLMLSYLEGSYTWIPPVVMFLALVYVLTPWEDGTAILKRSLRQQVEQARQEDERNHEENQKRRTAYSHSLEQKQRAQIVELLDQITAYEDQIDDLTDQLADNDLLVGNHIKRLDYVLLALERGSATSIKQALFENAAQVFTFDEEAARRKDQQMRSRVQRSNAILDQQQRDQLASQARQHEDDHARKVNTLRKEQNELLKEIKELTDDR